MKKIVSQYIFVKSEYKRVKITVNEIQYAEGLKDYLKIYLKDLEKPIITLMSVSAMEKELPSARFMRIHHSYTISLEEIEAIERNRVFINGVPISVSDSYTEEFNRRIARQLPSKQID